SLATLVACKNKFLPTRLHNIRSFVLLCSLCERRYLALAAKNIKASFMFFARLYYFARFAREDIWHSLQKTLKQALCFSLVCTIFVFDR
ncbi:MAG: hypothetical protein IJC92_07520, partial [Bacteroidaceae bacterium]|nr:hypothetical protein [Bacteroidaceae bacterium]